MWVGVTHKRTHTHTHTNRDKLDKQTIADVVLCYGLLKGLFQFLWGFAGDRYGRKWLIVGGLWTCAIGLVMMVGVGVNQSDPRGGFYVAALTVGMGTAMMYTNCLAAVCDHADPTWRSSALGAYRFWRDLGWAIGALVTGALADWIGIPWSIGVTAALTFLAGAAIAVFFEEVSGDELSEQAVKDTPPCVIMTNAMPQAHYPSMQQAPLMQAMQPYPFGGNQGQMPQMVGFPVQQMGTA